MKMTTLCYIEKDGQYLICIAPRRKKTSIRISGLVSAVMGKAQKVRKTAC